MDDVRQLCKQLYAAREKLERSGGRISWGLCEMSSSFSRVLRHLKHMTKVASVVMLSASRGGGDPAFAARNTANTKRLAQDIRILGLGYVPVVGSWVEDRGQATERKVREVTFVVPNMSKEQAARLAAKYGQQSFVWSEHGQGWEVVRPDLTPDPDVRWNRLVFDVADADAYTDVKGRKFRFENDHSERKQYGVEDRRGNFLPILSGIMRGAVSFEQPVSPWYGDFKLTDLREGDLVWWQSRGVSGHAVGCLVEILRSEDRRPLARVVEDGLGQAQFNLEDRDTLYVARVIPARRA